MASPKLDLVRSIFAGWERGDFSSADWAHPEIALVRSDGPSPGRWMGLAGMADGTRDWLNAWEDMHFDVDTYRELDDERVLVLVRYSGRGKASGLELGQLAIKRRVCSTSAPARSPGSSTTRTASAR